MVKPKPYSSSTRTSAAHFQAFPVAIVMVVVMAVGAALFSYSALYAGKIYPGVSIADTDLGGRTEENARALLEARVREYGSGELILRHQRRQWRTSPSEMGLLVDVDSTIEHGYLVGREGSLLDRLAQSAVSLVRGHQTPPVFSLDRAAGVKVMERLASEIDQPPVDARLVVESGATVRIVPPVAGTRLDVMATVEQFERSLEVFSTREVGLVVVDVPAPVAEADLVETRALAQEMVSVPLLLKNGEKSWSLAPNALAEMLVFVPKQGSGSKFDVELDGARLAGHLRQIAPEVYAKPQDATIAYRGGEFTIRLAVDGRELDLEATAGAVFRELTQRKHTAAIVTRPIRPTIDEESLARVKAAAQTMIGQPVSVKNGDRTWTLSQSRLARMLTFSRVESNGKPKVVPVLDNEALGEFIDGIAQSVNQKPRDARFQFANGKLGVKEEAIDGISVDVERTAEAINALAATSYRQASLIFMAEKAKIQGSDAAKIVVKDLLASSTTSYAGGIPARNRNVELATSRLNGIVVPPGEVFSMNESLGPTTLASGYQIGYGITVSGTNVTTVPSVAGGICQVATTLFHSAFWAGLKVEERFPHLYWIPRYGQPPKGMKGLDATVDDPWVDLKFRNNTGNWIAIQSYTSDWTVHFAIYGLDPGWKVTAEGPFISSVVPADQKMIEEEDPQMPEGSSLLVEHAEDGFDSTIVRRVAQNGKEIDRYVVSSHYNPSRNVTLVPKKAPQPTPAPAETP